MIDLHCHLDLYSNPGRIVDECVRRELYVLSVTNTPSAWAATNRLSMRHKRIKTALGLHPVLAKERISELPLFDKLINETRYIGEIGLDGSKECKEYWHEQTKVFTHILSMCQRSSDKKIISIHSRNASKEVLDGLEIFSRAGKFILHWYSGSLAQLKRAIDLDCWFSINPMMLKSAKGRKLAKMMPANKVLLESDGPFTQQKGIPLKPWDTDIVLNQLSEIWYISSIEAGRRVMSNFRELLK